MEDIPPGTCLKITKTSPRHGTPDHGTQSGIELRHWAVGFLDSPIEIGQPVYMTRFLRDGLIIFGRFNTSPIIEINGPYLKTKNSIYKVERVARLDVILED